MNWKQNLQDENCKGVEIEIALNEGMFILRNVAVSLQSERERREELEDEVKVEKKKRKEAE